MTRVLLDTSAYVAFLRGHPDVVAAVRCCDEIHVTPVVLGELLAGFRRGTRRRKNEEELCLFLSSSRVRVTGIDRQTADRYASIVEHLWRRGRPIPTNDVWIAATAMQHGLRVLATDKHFCDVEEVIVDYFESR